MAEHNINFRHDTQHYNTSIPSTKARQVDHVTTNKTELEPNTMIRKSSFCVVSLKPFIFSLRDKNLHHRILLLDSPLLGHTGSGTNQPLAFPFFHGLPLLSLLLLSPNECHQLNTQLLSHLTWLSAHRTPLPHASICYRPFHRAQLVTLLLFPTGSLTKVNRN